VSVFRLLLIQSSYVRHPAGLGIQNFRPRKNRKYLNRSGLLRLGSLCSDFSGHLARALFPRVHPSVQ
jgi:hypothetical protein